MMKIGIVRLNERRDERTESRRDRDREKKRQDKNAGKKTKNTAERADTHEKGSEKGLSAVKTEYGVYEGSG